MIPKNRIRIGSAGRFLKKKRAQCGHVPRVSSTFVRLINKRKINNNRIIIDIINSRDLHGKKLKFFFSTAIFFQADNDDTTGWLSRVVFELSAFEICSNTSGCLNVYHCDTTTNKTND